MGAQSHQSNVWSIAREQEGVITHAQLEALGYSRGQIKHRRQTGRLFRVHQGVYAVGRGELTQEGRWTAAVLACGEGAALSHDSAAELWRLAKRTKDAARIHVSVLSQSRSRKGIDVHRRTALNTTTHNGIRVTTPAQTLIDVAPTWPREQLEQAIGDADLRRLVSLRALRTAARRAGRPGGALRAVIDRVTFRVTQSELERELLRLLARARLPLPDTQVRFGKTRVDFHWRALGLVVEADGARFHAGALQQTADRRRDQAHLRVGRTPLRITHAQVFCEPAETTALLAEILALTGWRAA